jgi:hypothetical protein
MKATGTDGMIYVPVMDITYTDRDVAELDEVDESEVSSPIFTMKTTWTMNFGIYYTTITIIGALGGSLAGILGIYQAKSWGVRNRGIADTLDINVYLSYNLRLFID